MFSSWNMQTDRHDKVNRLNFCNNYLWKCLKMELDLWASLHIFRGILTFSWKESVSRSPSPTFFNRSAMWPFLFSGSWSIHLSIHSHTTSSSFTFSSSDPFIPYNSSAGSSSSSSLFSSTSSKWHNVNRWAWDSRSVQK